MGDLSLFIFGTIIFGLFVAGAWVILRVRFERFMNTSVVYMSDHKNFKQPAYPRA